MGGVGAICTERERQISEEGWTPEHDDEHSTGEMAAAASCYALHSLTFTGDVAAYRSAPPPENWPWDAEWWKPKNPQRDLVRAGALIAAEIDRVDRDRARRYAEVDQGPSRHIGFNHFG